MFEKHIEQEGKRKLEENSLIALSDRKYKSTHININNHLKSQH